MCGLAHEERYDFQDIRVVINHQNSHLSLAAVDPFGLLVHTMSTGNAAKIVRFRGGGPDYLSGLGQYHWVICNIRHCADCFGSSDSPNFECCTGTRPVRG